MCIRSGKSIRLAGLLAVRTTMAVLLSAVATVATAATIYVSPLGDDGNAGTVAAPKATIQAGITAAGSGGVIVLGQGNYAGAGNAPWDLSGIPANGSIAIQAAEGKPDCVIDCGKQPLVQTDAASPINLTLSGLTIQNAQDRAITLRAAGSLTATDCVFRDNHNVTGGTLGGAAVRLDPFVPGSFVRCRFSDNGSDVTLGFVNGGAVQCGAATFAACVFDGNRCSSRGGAVDAWPGSVFTDCRFTGNTARNGGAVFIEPIGGPQTQFTRCRFRSNRSPRGMAVCLGGSSSYLFADCEMVDNVYDNLGHPEDIGAALFAVQTTVNLANCTITGNTSTSSDPDTRQRTGIFILRGSLNLANCILRVRDGDLPIATLNDLYPASISVSQTDISGGWSGTGNIDADPRFGNPLGGDYHLLPTSPCIDAGTSAAVNPGDTDLDGHPRVFGPAPDMGAYELFVSNVTAKFTVSRGPWTYDRTNGVYTQTITLTNAGPDIATPVYLVLSGVTGGTVQNATGVTANISPAGQPYLAIAPSGLAQGASATATVTIHSSTGPIGYTPLVYTGSGTP